MTSTPRLHGSTAPLIQLTNARQCSHIICVICKLERQATRQVLRRIINRSRGRASLDACLVPFTLCLSPCVARLVSVQSSTMISHLSSCIGVAPAFLNTHWNMCEIRLGVSRMRREPTLQRKESRAQRKRKQRANEQVADSRLRKQRAKQ